MEHLLGGGNWIKKGLDIFKIFKNLNFFGLKT